MNNNKNEKDFKKESEPQIEELLSNIRLINNKLNQISSIDDIKSNKIIINETLNNISNISEKIIKERNIYESLLQKEENVIRKLYRDLLYEKILKEILEEKITAFMKMQSDYELIKEKTGVIVFDGKIISDGRKENEINILKTENSILKNVVSEKEKEIKELNDELNKYKINNNNTNIFPHFSQRNFTINNNFSSTTRNFYKSFKVQTKLLNKTKDKSNKSNILNIQKSDITKKEKISVNTNKFNNNRIFTSRNKCSNSLPFTDSNYTSCENIINKSKRKYKKVVNKTKIYYPMREYNSVRYINTQSNSNKENINNNEINCNDLKNKNEFLSGTLNNGLKISIKK